MIAGVGAIAADAAAPISTNCHQKVVCKDPCKTVVKDPFVWKNPCKTIKDPIMWKAPCKTFKDPIMWKVPCKTFKDPKKWKCHCNCKTTTPITIGTITDN